MPPAQLTRRTLALSLAATATAAAQPMPAIIHPSQAPATGQVTIPRTQSGMFILDAAVNGAQLRLMFDTGAAFLALRHEDTARIGIDPASLDFSVHIDTANGRGIAARATIASCAIGTIQLRDVAAIIHQPGRLAVNLLGQSVLARLAGYRVDRDRLILLG